MALEGGVPLVGPVLSMPPRCGQVAAALEQRTDGLGDPVLDETSQREDGSSELRQLSGKINRHCSYLCISAETGVIRSGR